MYMEVCTYLCMYVCVCTMSCVDVYVHVCVCIYVVCCVSDFKGKQCTFVMCAHFADVRTLH